MNEFGHTGIIGNGICIDSWGSGPFVMEADGKSYRFEDSDRFGPSLLLKNGNIASNPYPPMKSYFWRQHRIWVRQGRRVGADGITCVWDEPKQTIIKRIGKGKSIIVSAGEEDGLFIEEEHHD